MQTLPAFHVHPQRAVMEEELAAFDRQKSELLARHDGQFVAIFKGNPVDYDDDITTLVVRIDAMYPNEVVLIKRVSDQADQELVVRSPRLLLD